MREIFPILVIIVVIFLVWTSGCTNKTPITNQTSTIQTVLPATTVTSTEAQTSIEPSSAPMLSVIPNGIVVEKPNVLIDSIGTHIVGEKFTITGSTNLAVDDDLLIEIYSLSFRPTTKGESNEFSGTTGIVKVQRGTEGNNRWSFDVDTSAFKPDEYIVQVSVINPKVSGSTSFTIVDREVSNGIQQNRSK